jgi:hypothetical protein
MGTSHQLYLESTASTDTKQGRQKPDTKLGRDDSRATDRWWHLEQVEADPAAVVNVWMVNWGCEPDPRWLKRVALWNLQQKQTQTQRINLTQTTQSSLPQG